MFKRDFMRVNTQINEDQMVKLPYSDNIYLCPETLQRWVNVDGSWERDFEGENDWKKMASYVGDTYSALATRELNYARSKK